MDEASKGVDIHCGGSDLCNILAVNDAGLKEVKNSHFYFYLLIVLPVVGCDQISETTYLPLLTFT